MPAVPSTPRVKLRATSRRVPRARAVAGETEMEVDSEPNMRLSRAILVMLLLHVVAVGGILAFSLIKERNSRDAAGNPSSALEAEDSLVPTTKPMARGESAATGGKAPVHVVQPGETLTRIANDNGVTVEALIAANGAHTAMSSLRPGQALKLPEKSPEPSNITSDRVLPASERADSNPPTGNGTTPAAPVNAKTGHPPADSGKTYIVGKGESPYMIAQKLKVSYDSLLKLNHIDDPKKLKPGQKLRVPVPVSAKSREG